MIKMLICRCNLKRLKFNLDLEEKIRLFESKICECFCNKQHKYVIKLYVIIVCTL